MSLSQPLIKVAGHHYSTPSLINGNGHLTCHPPPQLEHVCVAAPWDTCVGRWINEPHHYISPLSRCLCRTVHSVSANPLSGSLPRASVNSRCVGSSHPALGKMRVNGWCEERRGEESEKRARYVNGKGSVDRILRKYIRWSKGSGEKALINRWEE